MAMIETPEYKAAVDRHLAGDSQKGEPMAQTDSDTLAKRIDEHDIQHDAVQKHLASLEDQIAELSKQQADSHAAILNALQQLSQPSPTASPAAQPTTTKE
jgi:septal ring factor EnvC (AmiA/AmiB activator)